MPLGGRPGQRRLRIERPVFVVAQPVVLPGERGREARLPELPSEAGIEVGGVLVEPGVGVGRRGRAFEHGVVLPVARAGEAKGAAGRQLPARREGVALVGRHVQPVDALARRDVEGRGRGGGIVVFEPRPLGIVVMGVVDAQIEAAGRDVAQRKVVQRLVAPLVRERMDVGSRRARKAVRIRREGAGVGGAHPPPLLRRVLHGGAQPVAPPLVGHPLILPDIVGLPGEGVPRVQVETRQLLAPGRRIGDVGRPPGRREREAAAGIVGVVPAIRVVGVHLAREGRLVAAAQHDVDRRTADVVLRRGAEHHLGPLHAIDRSRAQQRGQLLGGHRRGAPVQNHRDGRGAGQRQRPLLLRNTRQARQGLVGVVHGLPLGQSPEVVVQPPLLDLHHGPFALDHDGIDRRRGLRKADVAQIGKVRLDGAELVGQMLDLQPVGAHRRAKLETSVRTRGGGPEVDRVAVEEDDGRPGDGGIRRIDDPAPDCVGSGRRRCCLGCCLGHCTECCLGCCLSLHGSDRPQDRDRNQQKN